MYILAIETTGPLGSTAIIDENGKITMKVSGEEMNHLKDLMPMAQALITELGIEKKEISAVAVSVGPGSFTGIRIGVSTARALAQALNISAISVPTLDSFKQKKNGTDYIVPIFNARRGQVYGGIFDSADGDVLKSGPYMLTDVLTALKTRLADDFSETNCGMPCCKTVTFYGDGIDAYESQLNDFIKEAGAHFGCSKFVFAPKEERYQTASMTAKDGLAKFTRGETLSVGELLPEYMRMTEAEQKLKDGSLAKERSAKMAKFKAR